MAKSDYYDLLGLKKGASDDEIKRAYRKQAMRYHPDKNQGDKAAEEKFKEINEAYDVLKDPQRKAAYDQFGHAAFEHGAGGGRSGGGAGAGGFDFNFGGAGGFSDIFSDIFSDFMGGGQPRGGGRERRGQDLRYDISASLEEAFRGSVRNISFRRNGRCPKCGGAGGEKKTTCPRCHGSGVLNVRQGFFVSQQACPDCGGLGFIFSSHCSQCGGSGVFSETRSMEVKIPAGVDNGTRLRISGEGDAGLLGAASGDLYLYISVAKSKVFAREGRDLYLKLPISIATAALGGSVEVPVIDGGRVEVKIPKGSQPGIRLKLKSRGMTAIGSTARGDMIMELDLDVPVKMTARQEELLRQFEEESRKAGAGKGFFDRMKDWV